MLFTAVRTKLHLQFNEEFWMKNFATIFLILLAKVQIENSIKIAAIFFSLEQLFHSPVIIKQYIYIC